MNKEEIRQELIQEVMLKVLTENPDELIRRKIVEFFEKDVSEAKSFIQKVTAKGEKATLEEYLICKGLTDLIINEDDETN